MTRLRSVLKEEVSSVLGRLATAYERQVDVQARQADALGRLAVAQERIAQALDGLAQRLSERSEAEAVLAEKRRKKAQSQSNWRKGRNAKSARNVDSTVDNKEVGEGEREKFPPAPLLREKGEEGEESLSHRPARARESQPDESQPDDDLGFTPPALERVIRYAAHPTVAIPEAVAREAHAFMQAVGWRNRDNEPIKNWKWFVKSFAANKPVMDKAHDPNRLYDARSTSADRRTAEFERNRREAEETTRIVNEAVYKDDFMAKFFAEKERERDRAKAKEKEGAAR